MRLLIARVWPWLILVASVVGIVCYVMVDEGREDVFSSWDRAEIGQIFVHPGFQHSFGAMIFRHTKLRPYSDLDSPAFFYGLGSPDAADVLFKHKGKGVIIFTGGDSFSERPLARRVFEFAKANRGRIVSIAISNFIARSLERHGVPYVEIPFFALNLDLFKPVVLGNAVYIYGTPDAVYHNDLVIKHVQPHFPMTKFIYGADMGSPAMNGALSAPYKHYDREALLTRIYPQCFMGIRLTDNDGLAGTVQELGLMGIRSIWNGGTPSALPWATVDDIIETIRTEKSRIGSVDARLAAEVRKFLEIDASFYKLETYFPIVSEPKILVLGVPASGLTPLVQSTYPCWKEEKQLEGDPRFTLLDAIQSTPADLKKAIGSHKIVLVNSLLVNLLVGWMPKYEHIFSASSEHLQARARLIKEQLRQSKPRQVGVWLADIHDYSFSGGLLKLSGLFKDLRVSLILTRYLHTQDRHGLFQILVERGIQARVQLIPLHVQEPSSALIPFAKRDIDVLAFGNTFALAYPFRSRLFKLLPGLKAEVVICDSGETARYIGKNGMFPNIGPCRGDALSKLLNRAKIAIVTPGAVGYMVEKYSTVPAHGAVLAGQACLDSSLLFSDSEMIHLDPPMLDRDILGGLRQALGNLTALKDVANAGRKRVAGLSLKHYANHVFSAVNGKSWRPFPHFLPRESSSSIMKHSQYEFSTFLETIKALAGMASDK